MEPRLNGIVIIVGAYGSGKTEVSINLALHMKRSGTNVRLADLDLVNPYFRSREARHKLERLGVDVVLPPDRYMHADLPILTPKVSGMLRKPSGLTLLDVGGDDVGATVLAALAEPLADRACEVLMVINPHRPYTDSVEGCLMIKRQIEAKSRLQITGIVSNANLMAETKKEDVLNGYEFCLQVAEKARTRLVFITVDKGLLTQLNKKAIQCPILPIRRQLTFPWQSMRV
jgi:MinD-like ATPase involved in chromosome partitioning or flagellar assembly